MEYFVDEEEFWKCPKHPSRSRNGVCPACLKDRLILLCPECAHLRPCGCSNFSDFSSSSSSSSSLSSAAGIEVSKSGTEIGAVGRVSFLINSEHTFTRSRSAAVAFVRQKPDDSSSFKFLRQRSDGFAELQFRRQKSERKAAVVSSALPESRSRSWFWTLLRSEKRKKRAEDENSAAKLPRSRSIRFSCYYPVSGGGEISAGDVRLKSKGWHFPSPMKVFRQPKTVKIAQQRSPLSRG